MADKDWKQVEREAAKLFGGKRFPANSGHRVDGESHHAVWQVKHRKSMTFPDMFRLAQEMEDYGGALGKDGYVYLRDKPGRGKKSTSLVIMTDSVYKRIFPLPEKGDNSGS